jgi:hypothetical protein
MLVGIGLVALYLGYSRLTSPWLTVEQKKMQLTLSSSVTEKSPVFSERAETWFKEDPWVKDANARFGDRTRFMYFQNYELFNDDHSIKVDPIAMLWQDDETEIPYTLTARSAQLDATSEFKLDSNEFGAISSGQLQGDVRITGPDGFRLEGRTFSISDNAMKVTTSQPVRFWWGPHSGVAESGAEIDLLSSGDAEKKGLMSVSDVQKIRLLGRIKCQLFFQDEDARSEAITLNINAANGFEFFVPTHQATFFGFSDQKIRKDNQILIERPTISGGLDRLFCSMLTLQFQPAVIYTGTPKQRSTQLQLASIRAEGARVIFTSLEQNLTAVMSWLRYHVDERVMELSGGVTPATGRPNPVKIYQNSSMVSAAYVIAAHDLNNQIQSIQCRGPGQIEPSDLPSTKPHSDLDGTFNATWTESLTIRQSPEQKIIITGQATVSQTEASADAPGMSLSGDVIEMTGRKVLNTSNSVSELEPAAQKSGLDLSHISPKELVATGNVTMTHNAVTGHVRQKLAVSFDEATDAVNESTKIRSVSQSTATANAAEEEAEGTTEFFCDTATANINFTRRADSKLSGDWNDVWLVGQVKINHSGVEKDRDFSAEGNALSAKSGFSEVGNVSLFGDPAKARLASHRIEGPQIDLQELLNEDKGVSRPVTVPGSGSLLLVVDQGIDGKTLEKPSLLEIYWTESMIYSGRTASLVGNIRAVMTNDLDHKIELTCPSMDVYFTEDLQLRSDNKTNRLQASGTSTDTNNSPIKIIKCNSKVVVDIDQMKNGIVESRNHAEFSDLTVNMITGDFEATGSGSSGIIESTHPNSSDTPRTAPRAIARANTPVATPSDAFVFVQARFIGGIQGNYKKRFVQLRQHVRGVFGPVRQMGDRIVLDGLNVNELPPNTGSMRCENLSFSQIESGDSSAESQFEMVAESNMSEEFTGTRAPCHLESSEISGDADWIKYDSSKQQFILRASKGRQATVSYRRAPGATPETLTGQQFEYYRERNQLKAHEITGVQTAGDLRSPGR